MPPTGGATRAVCPGPPMCSNKIRSSVTFQSSFFKGLVSLYFRLKSACSFASRFMLLTQIMHNYQNLTRLLRSPLARAPSVVLFDLKPLIEDGNLQVYMYCVHARKRASGAPEHTSEHVKSQNFQGRAPRPSSDNPFCGATLFVFALGPPPPPPPPPILSAALQVHAYSFTYVSMCDLPIITEVYL